MILIYARIWITKDTQTTRIQLLIFKQYNVVNNFRFDQIIEKRASGTINTENRENIQNLKLLIIEQKLKNVQSVEEKIWVNFLKE